MTRRLFPGLLVPGVATLLLVGVVVLYLTDRAAYFGVLNAINEHPFRHPFLDTRFVTAQVECWQRGIDVYARNPCDPLGRTQDYSPLWLRLRVLGRPDCWTPLFGLATDTLFVGSLFLIPWRRAGVFATGVSLLAVASWATAFGLERGNTDLLIFAGCVVFAHLRMRSAAARGAGYALVLGMGVLKFYPLVLLALAWREPARRMAIVAGLSGALLLAFVAAFHGELARIGANMATGYFGDKFGVRTLPIGLVAFWRALCEAHGSEPGPAMRLLGSALVFAALMTGTLAGAVALGRDGVLRNMLAHVAPPSRSLLLVGAVLCVGCFFGHQNIGYRAVMLLLTLPGLLELGRMAPHRRVFRASVLLVVVALWGAAWEGTLVVWLVVQLAWWWIVGVLGSIVWVELEARALPWTRHGAVAPWIPLLK